MIRNLIIRRDAAETGNSKLYEEELREQEKDRERDRLACRVSLRVESRLPVHRPRVRLRQHALTLVFVLLIPQSEMAREYGA